jgi:hypothetical protein
VGRGAQDFSAPRAATASMSRKPKRGTLCFSCMTIRMQIDDRFISLRPPREPRERGANARRRPLENDGRGSRFRVFATILNGF